MSFSYRIFLSVFVFWLMISLISYLILNHNLLEPIRDASVGISLPIYSWIIRYIQVFYILFSLIIFTITGVFIGYLKQVSTSITTLLTKHFRAHSDEAVDSTTDTTPPKYDHPKALLQRLDSALRSWSDAYNALEIYHTKTNSILEVMTDGVVILNPTGHIILINPAARKMFNITEENVLQKSLITVMRYHQIHEVWEHCLKTQEIQYTTLEIPAMKQYLHVIGAPLKDHLSNHVLLLFQDLTELQKLENTRRDFISNISHELRTPLASLSALAETLLDMGNKHPKTAAKFIRRIQYEVQAMDLLIRQLLDLSKIETGNLALDLQAYSPHELIEDTVKRIKEQFEKKSFHLQVDCDPNLPLAMVDPARIQQVLLNMLQNALQFTAEGGHVRIYATSDESAENIIFSVEDDGIGIPEEHQSRIFERFYKVDRSRASQGFGLGLAIAKHIIQAHGGAIWVESQPGKGSTFSFSVHTSQP